MATGIAFQFLSVPMHWHNGDRNSFSILVSSITTGIMATGIAFQFLSVPMHWHNGDRNSFSTLISSNATGTMATGTNLQSTQNHFQLKSNYKWHYITGITGTISPEWVAQWQPDYPLFRQSRIFTQTDLPH
jgi:hypothetical protein